MNRRRGIFVAVTVSVSFTIALVCAEMFLRLQSAGIRGSESMDTGLIQYDRELGWRLQPDWQGTHRHHDYSVRYSISAQGFRGPWPTEDDRPHVALVGDSFTFGLGVADDATFARRLEGLAHEPALQVTNLGVPGYSTDQETLLMEQVLAEVRADQVVMVVCLINDVFDNERLFPLQATHGKPRFRLDDDGGLTLENVPVPFAAKPESEMKSNLASLVTDNAAMNRGSLSGWLGRQEIVRRLGWFRPSFQAPSGFYDERFGEALRLFDAIVGRASRAVQSTGATFALALLPGRSFVEDPGGYSAQYQEFLRQQLIQRASANQIAVTDLAVPLRKRFEADSAALFHPHDGHLNGRGHAEVAALLHQSLQAAAQDAAASL
jgi:hypothetical protein